jgi:hypothetical protein
MLINELQTFRLVGGTSLSLQLGHRKSVDIDLFTDVEYGRVDFTEIENVLKNHFNYVDKSSDGIAPIGRSFFVGDNKNDIIKLDLFHTDNFVFPYILRQNVRFASIEEVSAMKLEVIANGGRKKDFWDLHELFTIYTLDQIIGFYLKRYPYSYSKNEILSKLGSFSSANDDFEPICLKQKNWELIKLDIQELIEQQTS